MRQVSGCSEVLQGFLPVFADFRHFSALFTGNSPVAGSVGWPFLSFLGNFSPGIPLLQGSFVGHFLSFLGNFCHVILLLKGPFIAHFVIFVAVSS